ncbi:MAG: hypothetical protein KatS3mg124_1299 [Porticoccaceae bacterium]|nr:MAG: hypothetical protein KatS3mg124_1299 [Porticoccaceae bacterium]
MNSDRPRFADPDLWLRFAYMVLFAALTWLARWVALAIAFLQFLLALFTGRENENLRRLGDGLAQWLAQAWRFLTFASERKPYPFDDWPEPAPDPREVAPAAPTPPPAGGEDPERRDD